MLKGEKYIAYSLLVFGVLLFVLGYIGLPWWQCLIIAIVPAAAFVSKSVKWADKYTDGVSNKISKKNN